MCVDYTDLNKHCPKDHFGLPRIDQVVDSTAGCALLCFLHCYSGYHQIALKEEDQIKTAFITPFGTYAYKSMSFGLKNAGATYQRAIQMCFADQLHRNVEAYDGLIADLEETFSSLHRFWWKLNPTKCIFGVPSGKLLGFIVSNRGIEANPMKISAITDTGAPATIRDVQKLTGCMVALNRFISRLGERGVPFFKLLKHQEKFQWMEEAERALQDLKHHLQSPSVLTAPLPGEDLLPYIAATNHVVSSAIIVERSEEGHAFGVQRPMYFISEVLSESKVQYPAVQKLLYAILITSRKLRHYFDEYKITVIMDFPLADILHNQDATGRISKWAVELGSFSIDFKPCTAIKSQALVDFMAEWRENQIATLVDKPEHWTMYFDGSLKLDGGGAGILFISPRGEQLKYVFQILWEVSNNEAKYEAQLHGLCLAISLGIKRLLVYGDSLLVVQQVNKEWDCNKETMDAYVQEVRKLENKFSDLEVHHVVREHNVGADILSKLGSTHAQVLMGVFVQELKRPSIKSSPQITTDAHLHQPDREVMTLGEDWREAYIDFIRDQRLPSGMDARSAEAGRVMRRSKGFFLVNSNLYRRGARSGVLIKCVTREDSYDILREIHEGICGNHAASRTLVGKAYRAGFWWPTAVSDAEDLVRRCQNCQFFGRQSHVPAHSLMTIPPSWSFACWSLDIFGPFTTVPGGFTHVLVAIDKFTKWIEYKPIAKLTSDRVVDFISDILHRFGFPNTIITDLGSNFTANQFWEFCENACIKVKYVSVAHPRANGQVERANGMIIDGLKKRLYDENSKKGGKWIHELPHVVWGLRT
jgi:ribonuclease HI